MTDDFLKKNLKLALDSDKIIIRKCHQGIDSLGYVILPHYWALRTKTKRRMFGRIKKKRRDWQNGLIPKEVFNRSLQSYFGILKHCKGHKIRNNIFKILTPP